MDYRRLNELSRKDAYPLPRIDACLDAMNGARWFSNFHLRSGYHQVVTDEESREKTTFVTREFTFKFRIMPFGLTGASATFQRLMDVVMSCLNLEVCLLYLDDVIVSLADTNSHIERLGAVFERLHAAGLKWKPPKCRQFQRRVEFLGHIVSEDGKEADPEKVEAVATWPVLECVHDLRSFIGLCSYYRHFVKGFAKIAALLHALTGKSARFQWSQKCQIEI